MNFIYIKHYHVMLGQIEWPVKKQNKTKQKPHLIAGGSYLYSCLKPAQVNNSQDPISKMPNIKKDWWSASRGRVSEHLPSKHEALSSDHSTTKNKNKTTTKKHSKQ
jgi:hypothetical protein